MIKVTVVSQDHKVKYIKVKGHANYGDYGHDIVCAAVTSIVTTTINAIVRIEPSCIEYEEREGFISIELKDQSHVVTVLIENMLDLLKELEEKYQKNIKMNKEVSSC